MYVYAVQQRVLVILGPSIGPQHSRTLWRTIEYITLIP